MRAAARLAGAGRRSGASGRDGLSDRRADAVAARAEQDAADLLPHALLEFRLFRAIWITLFLTRGRFVSHAHSLANRDEELDRNS